MIFLSGAGGFLASHILKQGLQDKLAMSCQYRSLRAKSYLYTVKENVISCQLDLVKNEIPINILNDCHTVINTVGNTDFNSQEQLIDDNLNATKKLYIAAAQAGVRHWIQISSIATICDGKSGLINEKNKTSPRSTTYAQAKYDCNTWLKNQKDIPQLTIVHPTYMFGAWDSKPSSGGVLIAMRMGKIKTFIDGTKNFVAAQDVADGVFKIIKKNFIGEIILGGYNHSISEFVEKTSRVLGLPKDQILLGQSDSAFVREFCQSSAVDISYAKRAINYAPKVTLDEMLNETHTYFKEKKMIL
ncbi:MAG: NAD-dependent epimerase/dehydratase family protein [Oligoflexia bacterium]|nr:NAD-dependent epimerase/dehydratase family protein [Oligoflexia bacterium]